MTPLAIDNLIECQSALMRAIDARDVAAIEEATRLLAAAVERAQVGGSISAQRPQLDHALKQSNALKIRVNTLTDWTRQRIDRLTELRGGARMQTYSKYGKATHF